MASNPWRWLPVGITLDSMALVLTLLYQVSGHPEINPLVNILSVLFGAFLTAMIALSTVDYLNEQNQLRQWRRDYTHEAFGPVYTEVLQNIVNLSGLYPVVTDKWNAIEKDPKAVVIDRKAWEELRSFYGALSAYQKGYGAVFDQARRVINEILTAEFVKVHNPDISGMASAFHNDWATALNGDLLNLLHPNVMAMFLQGYSNTVIKRDSTMTFLSAEDLVKKVKQTLAADEQVKWLLESQLKLRTQAEVIQERLRAELQRSYCLKSR